MVRVGAYAKTNRMSRGTLPVIAAALLAAPAAVSYEGFGALRMGSVELGFLLEVLEPAGEFPRGHFPGALVATRIEECELQRLRNHPTTGPTEMSRSVNQLTISSHAYPVGR